MSESDIFEEPDDQQDTVDQRQFEQLLKVKSSQIGEGPVKDGSLALDIPSLHIGTASGYQISLTKSIDEHGESRGNEETSEPESPAAARLEGEPSSLQSQSRQANANPVDTDLDPYGNEESMPVDGDERLDLLSSRLDVDPSQSDEAGGAAGRDDGPVMVDANIVEEPGPQAQEEVELSDLTNRAISEDQQEAELGVEMPYAPEARDDNGSTAENTSLKLYVLANDISWNAAGGLRLESASLISGGGTVRLEDGVVVYDPGSAYDYLASGEQSTVTVAYHVSDASGLSDAGTATIIVTGSNDGPILSSPLTDQTSFEDASFHYQAPEGSFNDIDASDILSYTATLADGSPLPAWLTFDPATRTFSGTPDNDDVGLISVSVIATDLQGASATDSFDITITNTNDTPTDLTLSGGGVNENAAAGTLVATLSGSDPDAGETLSYSLADNAGGLFTIDAATGEVRVAAGANLDHEAAASHDVTVRVTDAAGEAYDETFTLNVADLNEGPTDLTLSGGGVNENAAAGTLVATLSGSDPDAGETLSYSLADNAGGLFTIDAATGEVRVAAGANLDHEAAASHDVTVRVTDAAGEAYDETFTLNVADLNEGPTDLTLSGGGVNENAAAGTLVATLSGSDPDAGETLSYSLADNAGGLFTIDAATGEVRVAAGANLDHEAAASHDVTVRVTDAAGEAYDETFTLNVADLNEGPTDLTLSGGGVNENAAAGTLVATLSGSDPDAGETLSYSLADNAGGLFTIDAATGEVRVAAGANLDHEAAASHDVTVRVTDAAGEAYDETFTLNVADLNEGPTDLTLSGGGVNENAAAGTLVATLSGSDPDAGETLSYSLADNAGGLFTIDAATGEVRVAAGANLDHEAAASHDVTVRVTDAAGEAYDETFTLNVADLNEGPTDLTLSGGGVNENAAAGTLVATLSGSDPDAGETLSYSLADNAGGLFTIDAATGEVRVAAGANLDHEAAASHDVTVRVTDAAGEAYDETFTLNVADLNEGPTDLTLSGGGVNENAAAGTLVATLSGSDPDAGETLSYSLADNAGGLFTIDAATGEVRVAAGANLDHEAAASHDVTVRVTDAAGEAYDETFTLNVADLNEGPTDLTLSGGGVNENAAAGTLVATLSGSDPDAGETLSYSLADNAGGLFTIDAATGEVRVAAGANLDHEAAASHDVTVRVTDAAGEAYDETFTLNVADLNEGPTDLTLSGGGVNENAAAGTLVATLSGSDPDAGETLSYSLADNAGGLFTIDAATGEVRVAAGANLDHEAAASHDVTVRVTDAAGEAYDETFTLNVADLNEGPTDLTLSGGGVNENAAAGTLVATLSGSDPDAGETLSYSLADNAGGLFTIDAATGEVRVAAGANLDHEAAASHDVTVRVTDAAGEAYDETFTLNVADLNEGPTDLTLSGGGVNENAAAGTLVATLSGSDPDAGETLSYSLADNAGGLFTIDAATGEVRVAAGANLDHEAAASHDVTVRVTDAAGEAYDETFTLNVADLNEGPTDLTLSGGGVNENAAAGTLVATLSGSDPDAGETLSYSLADNAGGLFTIDAATGEVRVAAGANLDHEAAASHDVTVRVTDAAGEAYDETFTLNVADLNEGPTDLTLSGGGVNENAAAGTLVATLSGSDPDAGETLSYSLADNAGGLFTIDAATGEVRVAAGANLDHEAAASHDVTVRVTDAAGEAYDETFTLNVADLNEGPTDLTLSGGGVNENAAAGTLVATLSGSDPDAGETLSYSLADNAGGLFTIDAATGEVRVAAGANLDHEAAASHDVTVRVTDAAGEAYDETFTLNVADLNEGPTDLTLSGGGVNENAAAGTLVATLSGSDPDAGETLSYSLADNAGGLFTIDAATGEVRVAAGANLDHEAAASHDVTVRVTDAAGEAYDETFTLNVADLNEGPTDLTLSGGGVNENAAAGTLVATLSGSDPDAGETLSYSLADNAGGLFTIDAATGEVRVAAGANLDHEAAASHDVTVRVTDAAGEAYDETFTLNVADLNEGPTDLTLSGGGVNENAAAGTLVATLSGSDPDAGETLSYSLADNAGGLFTIDAATGEVRVAAGANLDHEAAASHDVTVRVTDAAGEAYDETFTLNVADLNEGPTDLTLSGGGVNENAAAGTLVATLSGSDPDAGETLSYSLADNAGGLFTIDAATGEVRVAAGANLDHEAAASHDVTVRVTDAAGEAYDETFTLNVADLNEGPTDLTLSGGGVNENAAAGTLVATLSGSDPDAGETLSYSLADNAGGLFTIDAATGEVRVAAGANLDHEAAASHDVTVRVTDAAGEAYDETFTLNVADLNEGPTDLTLSGGGVNENAAAGTLVATLSGSDPDAGETLSYSLADNAGGLFTIDAATGEVRVAAGANLDHEAAASHDVTVRVTDAAGEAYDETFTLNVADLNEGPTDLTLSGGGVNENAAAGTLVATLSGSDPDAGETLSYSLADNAGGLFTIDAATGEVRVAAGANLDHEAAASHDVTVRVTDAAGEAYDETFTLNVADLNEGPTDLSIGIADSSESQVNSTTIGHQATAKVVDLADGGHVVLWTDKANDDVFGQRFDADGQPAGMEFQINETFDIASLKDAIPLKSGGFAVAMQSHGGVTSHAAIRIYNADGSPAGLDIDVEAYRYRVNITETDDGDLALAYVVSGGQVALQVVDTDGNTVVPEITIATAEWAPNPEIVTLSEGNLAIAWREGSGGYALVSVYQPDGTAVAGPIAAGAAGVSGGKNDSVDIVALPEGGFATTYESNGDIFLQIWNNDGTTNGAEVTVNADAGVQSNPEITALSNGEFFVVWQSDGQDGDGTGIYGQHLDASGNLLGDPVLINDTVAGDQSLPHIAELESGELQIVWHSDNLDGDGTGIVQKTVALGQYINENAEDGALVGRVTGSDPDTGETLSYSLADNADGRFAVDASTGEITVADGSLLDYEAAASHDITVQVTDQDGASYTEDFTIHVADNYTNSRTSGDDTITGTSGSDELSGGSGDDTIDGGAGDDDLGGGEGADTIYGGDGNDVISGGAGDDILDGKGGSNVIYGGDGNDTIDNNDYWNSTGDTVYGGAGNDNVWGSAHGDDVLHGGTGNDILRGEGGNDIFYGDEGADTLSGGDGADIFFVLQGQGNDTIYGGTGGGWTDMIELQDDNGGNSIGDYETDWTVAITSGSVESTGSGGGKTWLDLTDDAAGTITMQDGTEIDFTGIEHIQW